MPQTVSYLSWLRSARHEFEALAKEKLGSEVAEAIDWRNPRMVCIAAGFSHHDRVAVHDLHKRIDLVRYRVFDGGLLSLLLVESAPGIANPAPARRRKREIAAGAGAQPVPATLHTAPACLHDLYGELDEVLTASGEVEVDAKQHYIAYRRLVNVASVRFRPKYATILVYLKVDPGTVALEEGFSRDMRGIGHLGTGDLEVRIISAADLEKAGPLIRRAFEAA
jgi:predicted transport protein